MVATMVLSIVIFGSAGWVVYSRVKKGSGCNDCHTSCPAKPEEKQS